MRYFKRFSLIIVFIFVLMGCSNIEKDTTLTITPYQLSDKEKSLIRKTDVNQIEYFYLNGILQEDDDIRFSIEVYENGILTQELLKLSGELQGKYVDSLISFGISLSGEGNRLIKVIAGLPTGHATTLLPNEMSMYAFSKLIEDKVILEKNKPIYLAYWSGNTSNNVSSITPNSESGNLPMNIDKLEFVLVYKALWTDRDFNSQ